MLIRMVMLINVLLVEFRLTDINFHREVELLINGKYDELKEQVKQW